MSTQQLSPEEIRTRREAQWSWHGLLAADNVEHVRDRIERMLLGRPYTFVANNAALTQTPPEVRTTQRLTKPPQVSVDDSAHITCVDTYGVWGLWSDYLTEAEARRAANDGKQDVTYLLIEGDGTGRRDRIEIRQYNLMSPRELLHWVVMPEHPEWDTDA